ncbi:MAG: LysR family transcriptional regulator [Aliishimia sp.]
MARLDEIETFVAIVDAGTLTEASRRSGLALSAVSRRLRDLEARMGTTLIHRSTRNFSVSSEGQDFYLRCKQILSDLQEAETDLRDTKGRITGRIRIAAPLTFSVLHLSPILNEFMTLHPDVEIDLDLNDRQVDLVAEGFDLAIRIGRLTDSSLIAKRLTRIRHFPAVAPSMIERLGQPERPEDLAVFPALTYRSSGPGTEWRFVRPDGRKGSVTVKGTLACNNGDVLRSAAIAGLGVAFEPTFICGPAILEGLLTPLFFDHTWSDNAAYAVFPPGRAQTARVRALIEHIGARLAETPWWDTKLMERYELA